MHKKIVAYKYQLEHYKDEKSLARVPSGMPVYVTDVCPSECGKDCQEIGKEGRLNCN